MSKRSPVWRLVLAALLLALLVLPSIPVVHAQASWTQDGYVFDSTGQLSAGFIARFNAEVMSTTYPVYLTVVDESLLGQDYYAWDVAYNGLIGSGLLPSNFVMIVVAPFVGESSSVYDFAITELMAGGVFSPISDLTIPGHNDKAGPEIAAWIDQGVQEGNWEDTVIAGIREIVVASQALSLGSAPSSQPVVNEPQQPNQPVIVEEKIDYSRVFLVGIAAVVGLILLVAGIVGVGVLTKDRRKIGDARHKAAQSRTAAVNLISGFDEMWNDAGERLKFLELSVSKALIAPIRSRLTTLKSDVSAPLTSFESVGERFENPGANVSPAVYDEIRNQLEAQIVTPMREASESLRKVVAQIEELETQAETAPQIVAEIAKLIKQAEVAIAKLEKDGLNVISLRRELSEAVGLQARAQKALIALDIPLAVELADKSNAEAQQALDLAEEFKGWIESLRADHAAISARLDPVNKLIDGARRVMDTMAERFATSSWDELKTNPTRARQNVDRASDLLARAIELLSAQDYEKADEAIDNATLALQEAEMLCTSVTERLADLDGAVKKVKELHQAADRAVDAADAFISSHDLDVPEDGERRLEELQRQLKEISAALGESKPDYLAINKLLTQIIKVAGEILSKSKESVKAMDRAEYIAETEVESAQKATRRADAYIDDHRRDVDSDARERLDEAETLLAAATRALRQAEQSSDGEEAQKLELLKEAAKKAEDAETKANKALEMAQADVNREEIKRDRHPGGGSTTIFVSQPTYETPSRSTRRDNSPPPTYRPSPAVSRSTPSRPSYTPSRSTPSISRSTPSISRSSVSRSTPSVSRSTPSRGR